MPHHVHIFTYKTGLLSRVAHDLRLHPERVSISREGDSIRAQVDADSLRVDGVMRDGQLRSNELSSRDCNKIARTIENEILVARRYPTIVFEGRVQADLSQATGTLRIKGISRPLELRGRSDNGRLRASVEIQPSRFSIAPYKALAGAIRLQDRVRIELDLDASAL